MRSKVEATLQVDCSEGVRFIDLIQENGTVNEWMSAPISDGVTIECDVDYVRGMTVSK